ncbi:TrmB family transcriptional regulator [Halogeometricum sp. S1BR25-6]|uniref:TrmB family transcriptional regulator n=1 Tax=Halogeometricum salsisoli TaxID=2950536 RepID=A0ABU2G8Q3_9EURY|nr:helix-turn-helix domain-containing protein [Halogeometricum sp. S1BR25-6]MDS0297185.1 TrmB family transcriptional regulator [Halogeometricum sp. S1BR25-6]
MSSDPSDDPHAVAVEQLEALGLSVYAARTLVALDSLERGTAQEVSEVSEVPRTRVYDAVEELRERGLVDVQQSSPKQFWAVSAETVRRRFEREYTNRLDALLEALDAVDSPPRTTEQRGVWTVTGRESVTDRLLEFIDEATEEIVFMTVDELLSEEVLDRLRAASRRGVSIKVAGLSQPVRDDVREEVPGADPFESLWAWSETPAGRLLMVDREKTLVSVLVQGNGDHPPEPRDETAIWGAGETNGLVVVLKAMFTWELDAKSDANPGSNPNPDSDPSDGDPSR